MSSLSNVRNVRSTTTIQNTAVYKAEVPLKKLVYVVQDVSTSMEGSRLDNAIRGIKFIFDKCCGDTDHFALIAFNNSVHTVTPRRPKYAVKWATVAAETRKCCGGSTRLWDAVLSAMNDIKGMKRDKDVHVDLVVITDGDDNESGRGSVARLEAAMGKPGNSNFHAIFLACCGADVADMQRIQKGKKHVRVFEEKSSDPEAIARAFGRAQTVLLERRTTYTMDGSGSGARVVSTKQTITAKGPKNASKKVLAAAATELRKTSAPLQITHNGGGGSASRKQLLLTDANKASPLKVDVNSGGKGKGKGKGKGR